MVINKKASKMERFVAVVFGGIVFVEVLFVGIVFVSSIIWSHITTKSPIRLPYLPFLQLHFGGFQK